MKKKEMQSLLKYLKSEIQKVSDFFLKEASLQIKEGSACDNAVRYMRELTAKK